MLKPERLRWARFNSGAVRRSGCQSAGDPTAGNVPTQPLQSRNCTSLAGGLRVELDRNQLREARLEKHPKTVPTGTRNLDSPASLCHDFWKFLSTAFTTTIGLDRFLSVRLVND